MSFGAFLRSAVTVFLAICLATVTASLHAQGANDTPIGIPSHDAGAVTAIQSAITALGGENAAAAVKDTATTADCTKTSHGNTETHKLRWITSGDYFRVDAGPGDEKAAISGPKERSVANKGKIVPLSDRSARAYRQFHYPLALLRADMKPDKTKIELLPDDTLDGHAVTHVRITDIQASEHSAEPVNDEWFFDKTTYLPVRVTYLVQGVGSFRRFAQVSVDYSNFQVDQASGTVVPMTFQRAYDGGLSTRCVLSSFAVNQSPSEHMFTRDGGGN